VRRCVVSIDWRLAAAGWPGGQLYLLDLDRFGEPGGVLDHFVGDLEPDSLLGPGGWTGFRGVLFDGPGAVVVADADALRRFTLEGNRLRFDKAWTTRRFYDIHDIFPDPKGRGWWLSATDSDECVLVRPWRGRFLLEHIEVWEALRERALLPDRNQQPPGHDRWHINSVAFGPDGSRWALLHTSGRIVRFGPGPVRVLDHRCNGGHSIRVAPGGEVIVLHTGAEAVAVLNQAGKVLRRVECSGYVAGERIDPRTGKKAVSGWLRGCCVLDERLLLCGTSPAQLFLVDYQAGRVEGVWQLDDDVRASTFGIAVEPAGAP